jgi:hypothetical protein
MMFVWPSAYTKRVREVVPNASTRNRFVNFSLGMEDAEPATAPTTRNQLTGYVRNMAPTSESPVQNSMESIGEASR